MNKKITQDNQSIANGDNSEKHTPEWSKNFEKSPMSVKSNAHNGYQSDTVSANEYTAAPIQVSKFRAKTSQSKCNTSTKSAYSKDFSQWCVCICKTTAQQISEIWKPTI